MLSETDTDRYSRHLRLPEVGPEGQERLAHASALVIGAGGLGSPSSLYLAAAGVGRIGLVDFDRVELSNLQRQIVHSTSDVGRPKVESARERLAALNPSIVVETHATALSSLNAFDVLGGYDIILDGSDNFPTRYLVNDAAFLLRKPNVYGSIFRFEGQASVFDPQSGPCYRCLYPDPPPPGMVPSCEEGGVLGVLPGIIGTIQATEAIKLILGIGETLAGRLLLFDALGMSFRELRLKKNPECPLCGPSATIRGLIDYEQFCGERVMTNDQITPAELTDLLAQDQSVQVIDVREIPEWNSGRIEGAELIPLSQIPAQMGRLDKDRKIVLYCRSGARSQRAMEYLRAAGFSKVMNLSGGVIRWSREGGALPRP